MDNVIKKWLYIIGGILLIGASIFLTIQFLIWILPIILIVYIIIKVKNIFLNRKSCKNNSEYSNDFNKYTEDITEGDDTQGEVIDVDYEDVK